ncbi:arsenical-resistance protein, partial [Ectopseudomonas hydrolytica]
MTNAYDNTPAGSTGAPLGFFERYLSLWVFLCIAAGTALGLVAPQAAQAVGALEVAQVNIPVGVLIWGADRPDRFQRGAPAAGRLRLGA